MKETVVRWSIVASGSSGSDEKVRVIWFSPDEGTRLVKRVIGVPGDEIEMRQLRVFINGKPLEYGRLDEEVVLEMNAELRK
ncbi:MAG: signal peptidase I [Akkermansiaceae bacterium]